MVGVVMPHGILFRGGAEGTIRKGIVEADLFEAIIGLAPNLFYGASIPVAICILNKAKPPERRGKVLFVDANQPGYFRAGKAQNLLDDEHAEKIVEAFRAYEEVERFAHVAGPRGDRGERLQPQHQPLRRHHGADRGAQRRGGPGGVARWRRRRRDEAAARMDELLVELGYAR